MSAARGRLIPRRDKDQFGTLRAHWAAIPIAKHLLHGEPSLLQSLRQFRLTTEPQLIGRDEFFPARSKAVLDVAPDEVALDIGHLEPRIDLAVRHVETLAGRLGSPPEPRARLGVTAFEGEVATGRSARWAAASVSRHAS